MKVNRGLWLNTKNFGHNPVRVVIELRSVAKGRMFMGKGLGYYFKLAQNKYSGKWILSLERCQERASSLILEGQLEEQIKNYKQLTTKQLKAYHKDYIKDGKE